MERQTQTNENLERTVIRIMPKVRRLPNELRIGDWLETAFKYVCIATVSILPILGTLYLIGKVPTMVNAVKEGKCAYEQCFEDDVTKCFGHNLNQDIRYCFGNEDPNTNER